MHIIYIAVLQGFFLRIFQHLAIIWGLFPARNYFFFKRNLKWDFCITTRACWAQVLVKHFGIHLGSNWMNCTQYWRCLVSTKLYKQISNSPLINPNKLTLIRQHLINIFQVCCSFVVLFLWGTAYLKCSQNHSKIMQSFGRQHIFNYISKASVLYSFHPFSSKEIRFIAKWLASPFIMGCDCLGFSSPTKWFTSTVWFHGDAST